MKKGILAIACLAIGIYLHSLSYAEDLIQPSVVGGSDALPGQHPWMVALIRNKDGSIEDRQFCGGTLIHPNWVMTAAHCVENTSPDEILIALGENDLSQNPRLVEVSMTIVHPSYYLRTRRGGDIALLRLSQPITDITPLPINKAPSFHKTMDEGTLMGWGLIGEDPDESIDTSKLQTASVPILNFDILNAAADGRYSEDLFAVGNEEPTIGSRPGDSGSPFIIRNQDDNSWKAAGIASLGSANSEGNAFISYYTNVAKFDDWISGYVFNSLRQPESPKPHEPHQIKMGVSSDGNPTMGHLVWPFSDRFRTRVYKKNNFGPFDFIYLQTPLSLDLSQPDSYQYNGDGSFYLYQVLKQNEPTFAEIQTYTNPVLSRGPFTLYPNNNVVGITPSYSGFEEKKHLLFQLKGFRPGFTYTIHSHYEGYNLSLGLYEVDGVNIEEISSATLDEVHMDFSPNSEKEYWLQLSDPNENSRQFSLAASVTGSLEFSNDQVLSETLTASDHPYLKKGAVMDTFRYQTRYSQEVELIIDSVFDSEIGVYDSSNNRLIAYYDQDGRNAEERLILSGEDLYNNEIRVFNFNPWEYGDLTISVEPYTSQVLEYGKLQHRAITKHDLRLTQEDGDVQSYERFPLEDTDQFESIKIDIRGYADYDPSFAVFDSGGTIIASAGGSSSSTEEFDTAIGEEYLLLIAEFEEPRNVNYEIVVTGVPRNAEDEDGPPFNFSNPIKPNDNLKNANLTEDPSEYKILEKFKELYSHLKSTDK